MAKGKADLAEAVTQAETAVASIKDAELRRAAFEKILEHLLGGGSASKEQKKTPARRKADPKRRRGPQGYVDELVDEHFFKKPRTLSDVKAELANRGHHIPRTSLSGPLQNLCKQRRLRRQKGIGSAKDTFGYTNW
jgi:hypothetical protein